MAGFLVVPTRFSKLLGGAFVVVVCCNRCLISGMTVEWVKAPPLAGSESTISVEFKVATNSGVVLLVLFRIEVVVPTSGNLTSWTWNADHWAAATAKRKNGACFLVIIMAQCAVVLLRYFFLCVIVCLCVCFAMIEKS